VVNFWATWCIPCRDEMPEFVKAQREFGERGVQFVGIAVDDVAKVRDFAAELGLNYPALIGGYGAIELSKSLGNRVGALPYTVFIDRAGRINRAHLARSSRLNAIHSRPIAVETPKAAISTPTGRWCRSQRGSLPGSIRPDNPAPLRMRPKTRVGPSRLIFERGNIVAIFRHRWTT
jgi:thiol-disulfide isomerase/thioredoxin